MPRLAIEAIRLHFSLRKLALSAAVTLFGLTILVAAILAIADEASPLDGATQLGAIFGLIILTTGVLSLLLMRINSSRTEASGRNQPYPRSIDQLDPSSEEGK